MDEQKIEEQKHDLQDTPEQVGDEQSPEALPPIKEKNPRLRHAVIRMSIALLLTLCLLVSGGYSIITLLKGPAPTSDILANEQGDYVSTEMFLILGSYDEGSTDTVVDGRFSVVLMGGKLVTIELTDRYLENAATICNETYDFVNGKIAALDSYVAVRGTVSTLSEKQAGVFYDWYSLNQEQLAAMGLNFGTEDFSAFLGNNVLVVDTVDGRSEVLVFVLSGLAAACLLWAVVELLLMACGRYLKKNKAEEDVCTCACKNGTHFEVSQFPQDDFEADASQDESETPEVDAEIVYSPEVSEPLEAVETQEQDTTNSVND